MISIGLIFTLASHAHRVSKPWASDLDALPLDGVPMGGVARA